MPKHSKVLASLCAAALIAVTTATARASLIGDEITATVIGSMPNWTESAAVVGLGVEYQHVFTNFTVTADVGADTITLTYANTSSFPNLTVGANDFLFADLDWIGPPGTITSVFELVSNFPNAIGTSFTGDSITLHVPLTNTNPGNRFSATYRLNSADPVPEPSVALLVGIGLGLGVVGRVRARGAA